MIQNFGGNVRFEPASIVAPRNESELLEVLGRHRGRVRVLGAGHAWSPLVKTDQLLIDTRRLDAVRIWREAGGQAWVEAEGGCRIKHLLAALQAEGLTLPSVGLISEQSIAGATATGTHGSGRHSLSHYLDQVRLATFDAQGRPRIVTAEGGERLRAARCSLGALGVVVSARLRAVPQYAVEERLQWRTLEQALDLESQWPLQQFYLMPDGRRWLAQHRRVAERSGRSWHAPLYRGYWFGVIDLGLHGVLRLLVGVLGSRSLARRFMTHVAPRTVPCGWPVRDRSDRMLVMAHELFRHLETELFVPGEHVAEAGRLTAAMLARLNHGAALDDESAEALERAGTRESLESLRGEYSHHYPVCFRKVRGDDTLISMASGDSPWYAISLITYARHREPFYRFAHCASQTMAALYGARLHWGKHLPLPTSQLVAAYPRWDRFLLQRRHCDPLSRFSNALTDSLMPN